MLPPGPLYLTGVRYPALDHHMAVEGEEHPLGLLVQPVTARYIPHGSEFYPWVGVDNGCFSPVGRRRFTLDGYHQLVDECLHFWGDHVLFVTAPDVPGDWPATLAASLPVLDTIRGWGATVALVAQDGATPDNFPWAELGPFGAVFLGGSTAWKVGTEARALTDAARRRGLWVHMGRVNSLRRLRLAGDFGCGSADGTYLRFTGEGGIDGLLGWGHATLDDADRDGRRWPWRVEPRGA